MGIVILTAVTATGLAYPSPAGNPTAPWRRVWSGGLDGPAGPLDGRIWTYQTGQGIFGTGEVEVTTNHVQNVHLDGRGELDITALHQGGVWTSGRIISRRAFTPPAGRELMVTATLRQPDLKRGVGYWPAFWMLGRGTWPAHGEIDILEDLNALSEHSATLHCGSLTSRPCHGPTGRSSGLRRCPGCQTGYHSYSVIVDRRHPGREQIRWYLDNREFFSVTEGQVGRQAWDEAIHHGFNIIFDLAIGGSFPDVVCHCLSPLASTQSGGSLRIRSVAVYQN